MNPVYLWSWKRRRMDASHDSLTLNQPLFRRMTALQKAVLLNFLQLIEDSPEARALARDTGAPLFLCSAYGEIGPMLRLTQSILKHDLPVSPKDFQHSVLNAALSYLAINQDWHQPGYALSGGFAGPDSTLHLAAQRLSSGLDQACIIAHAHEHYGEAFEAESEILILSRNPPPQNGFVLEHSFWSRSDAAHEKAGGPLRPYQAGQQEGPVPWLIENEKPVLRRFVNCRDQLGWVTVWKAC